MKNIIRTKKHALSLFLAFLLSVVSFASALSVQAASKKAIAESDFKIAIGKKTVNLLTDDPIDVQKKLGGKFVGKLNEFEGSSAKLSTTQAVFQTWTDDLEEAGFITNVSLTKKGQTSRGIKLGSTKKALLAAYPAPLQTDNYDKSTTYYTFGIKTPDNIGDLNFESGFKLKGKRPLYIYVLRVGVSNKTNRVNSIFYDNQVAG